MRHRALVRPDSLSYDVLSGRLGIPPLQRPGGDQQCGKKTDKDHLTALDDLVGDTVHKYQQGAEIVEPL